MTPRPRAPRTGGPAAPSGAATGGRAMIPRRHAPRMGGLTAPGAALLDAETGGRE